MNPIQWAAVAALFTALGIGAWWYPVHAGIGLLCLVVVIVVVQAIWGGEDESAS